MAAWGDESSVWVGRRVTLYCDESVRFGKDLTGGIRISHASNLPDGKRFQKSLQVSRGKRQTFTVDPLPDAPADPNAAKVAALRAEWKTADDARKAEIQAEVQSLTKESA